MSETALTPLGEAEDVLRELLKLGERHLEALRRADGEAVAAISREREMLLRTLHLTMAKQRAVVDPDEPRRGVVRRLGEELRAMHRVIDRATGQLQAHLDGLARAIAHATSLHGGYSAQGRVMGTAGAVVGGRSALDVRH